MTHFTATGKPGAGTAGEREHPPAHAGGGLFSNARAQKHTRNISELLATSPEGERHAWHSPDTNFARFPDRQNESRRATLLSKDRNYSQTEPAPRSSAGDAGFCSVKEEPTCA